MNFSVHSGFLWPCGSDWVLRFRLGLIHVTAYVCIDLETEARSSAEIKLISNNFMWFVETHDSVTVEVADVAIEDSIGRRVRKNGINVFLRRRRRRHD